MFAARPIFCCPIPPLSRAAPVFQEPQPEVYGYYGRTASPPPSSSTTGSGAWASTPAPHYSVENDQNRVMAGGFADGDETAAGARGGVGGGGGGGEGAQPKGAGAEGAEAFVPDFGVPQGVVAPATVRQHIMMVGTARTAVRSPQVCRFTFGEKAVGWLPLNDVEMRWLVSFVHVGVVLLRPGRMPVCVIAFFFVPLLMSFGSCEEVEIRVESNPRKLVHLILCSKRSLLSCTSPIPSPRLHYSIAPNFVLNLQLEVLLRLKQQSNLAFSFLSDEDPIHPYYVFLKSWGENALAAEYTRQQRLQAERAEARRRAEEERKEREERAAAAKGPFGALIPVLGLFGGLFFFFRRGACLFVLFAVCVLVGFRFGVGGAVFANYV